MSAPAKVVAAVSNSNTSSDKTRFGKAKSQALAEHSFKLYQCKSQKGDLSLPERLHQARLCPLPAPVRVLPVPVTAAAVPNPNTRSDKTCFCKALHSTRLGLAKQKKCALPNRFVETDQSSLINFENTKLKSFKVFQALNRILIDFDR